MKNYKDSDYALNRYSMGIVYRFADRIVEVTLEDYLAENPDKTKWDFLELKSLSDAIYHDYDRAENAQTKKNDSIHWMENSHDTGAILPEEAFLEVCDHENALEAFALLLESSELTETQRRRFLTYIRDGMSLREIAKHECVTLRAVQQSIYSATDKLKKYFNLF